MRLSAFPLPFILPSSPFIFPSDINATPQKGKCIYSSIWVSEYKYIVTYCFVSCNNKAT